MAEISIVKKICKSKTFTSRPVERPKSRWEDDVRNDWTKMKLIKLTEQVQDRLKWKAIVEKVRRRIRRGGGQGEERGGEGGE
jgi:hypothetical protein